MKVAELYAQLGVKVDRHDLGMLKEFEHTLNGIASAAKNAALALKQLAQTPLSRGFSRLARTAATGATAGVGATTAPAVAPATPAPATPATAAPTPQQTTAQWWKQFQAQQRQITQLTGPVAPPPPQQTGFAQTLARALGASLLKTLGIASLAMAVKNLATSLKEMTQASMAAAFGVDKFTLQTGMSREELKRWEYVASLSDVTAEELQNTLKSLQQKARQIQFTGEGATPFLQLGINAMSSPTEIMRQFALRTRAMDAGTAVYFGKLIGISDNMVYMLRKNVDNLDKMLPDRVLTDAQQRAMMELNTEWAKFTFNLGVLRDRFIADLAPALQTIITLTDRLLDWHFSKSTNPLTKSFLYPAAMAALPGLLGASSAGGTTVNNNFNTTIENQGSGSAAADGRAMAKAFEYSISSKALYQRTPTFIGAGL